MSIDRVKGFFKQYKMDNRIKEFDVSSETVELAAKAVGCEPKQIAKTMAFEINGRPILITMAGDAKISNLKYKEQFYTKAKMIAADRVESFIGHDIGGVCPFAIHEGIAVFLDVSLKRFKTVYPGAGSGNSAIELTIEELEKYSHAAEWIDVCKDWK